MTPKGTLKVTTPTDREIMMTRVFNAPRRLVFDALSKPDLVKRWLFGPDGWFMEVCDIDFRVGGGFRYVWKHEQGAQMAMGGVFKEIIVPEKIVSTEKFDDPWYPGEAVGTIILTESDGRTTLTQTVQYESREIRDGVLKTPMEEGMSAGYDRLADLLATLG